MLLACSGYDSALPGGPETDVGVQRAGCLTDLGIGDLDAICTRVAELVLDDCEAAPRQHLGQDVIVTIDYEVDRNEP